MKKLKEVFSPHKEETTPTTTGPTTEREVSSSVTGPSETSRETYYGGTGSPSAARRRETYGREGTTREGREGYQREGYAREGTTYGREGTSYGREGTGYGREAYGRDEGLPQGYGARPESGGGTYKGERVSYERRAVEEPTRHESVGRGVTETFKHPVAAFTGQPRERSPTEGRRREVLIEKRTPEVAQPVEKPKEKVMEERPKPRPAWEIREERSKLPHRHRLVEERTVVMERPPERERVYVTSQPEAEPVLIEEQRPTVYVEHRERGPVIKEHIHPQEREEIQPIIHRERERTEVIQMAKPILERDVKPMRVEEKTLPAETRPTIVQGETEQFRREYQQRTERYRSSVEVSPVEREFIERPPIVKEHITRKVIEEVQPVIYREVTEPHIIKEVKPIYEKIVEGPILLETRELPAEERMREREYREPVQYIERREIPYERREPQYERREQYREERREPVRYIERREPQYERREPMYERREQPSEKREPMYVERREPLYREGELYGREQYRESYREQYREPTFKSTREGGEYREPSQREYGTRQYAEPVQYEYRELGSSEMRKEETKGSTEAPYSSTSEMRG